jgi:aminoglycoside phosphotransferase (APT) family kinase protein
MLTGDNYLERLIANDFEGARLLRSERLTGGVSANVTLLDVRLSSGDATRMVLREHGPSHCGHPVDLEFQLLRSLSDLGLAVPKPLAWGNADDIHRYPYVLLQHLEGSTDIADADAEKCIRVMATQLAAVHDVETDSLPQLPLRVDPRPDLLAFLPDEAEWHGLRSHLVKMQLTVFGGQPVLLHGDYWPRNIVWRNKTFVGIVDWEDAAIGDPLSDVACACLELSYLYEDWGSQCFLDTYRESRHIDPIRFALWQAYVAAAGRLSMANWGLEPAREHSMRQKATSSIREAACIIERGLNQ